MNEGNEPSLNKLIVRRTRTSREVLDLMKVNKWYRGIETLNTITEIRIAEDKCNLRWLLCKILFRKNDEERKVVYKPSVSFHTTIGMFQTYSFIETRETEVSKASQNSIDKINNREYRITQRGLQYQDRKFKPIVRIEA